jgi:hypothetical protein
MNSQVVEDRSTDRTCPFHAGMENHVGPYGDDRGVVVKATSDAMFGPDGLGFAGTPWMKLVSWLARSGISEQTGSNPHETVVKNCVQGWGQGAFSSHVFQADGTVDHARLEHLIAHLQYLAENVEGDRTRMGSATAAAFVNAQRAQPFRTYSGQREVHTFREAWSSRFRGHIQWQSLVALCGQVDQNGNKVLTAPLLRAFFGGEESFFLALIDRRRKLLSGQLTPGDPIGILALVELGIDREKTDRSYMRKKSSAWLLLKISYYMITGIGSRLDPL